MSFYECVYDCGCVDCASSIDNFSGQPCFLLICSDHKLKIGNKFKYNFDNFIKKYWIKHNNNFINHNNIYIYDVEIIDIIKRTQKEISFNLVRLKTNFNCSNLDLTKQIFFSELNDEPNWIQINSTESILTIIFEPSKIIRTNENKNLIYDWLTNSVLTVE